MRAIIFSFVFCTWATSVLGQESFKVSVLKEPPPGSIAAEVRSAMNGQGFRIQDDQGRTFADIWLRKAIPSSDKPAGPKGAVQFPFLADGELLGVLQFATEGHDYRDQPIAKGMYTMRYGLQPVNGDHLGVSTYRDYSLLLPASKDQSLALPPRKQLEERSADSAGTSHPAVFLMLTAPAGCIQAGSLDDSRCRNEHLERHPTAQPPGQRQGRADHPSGAFGGRGSGRGVSRRDHAAELGRAGMTANRCRSARVEAHRPSRDPCRLRPTMMPVSLLIALLLAFGIEPPPTGVPQADVGARVLETCGGITLVAALAFGLGFWVAFQVAHSGHATSRLRRRYALGARLLTILSLVVYGWIIHSVGWSKLVERTGV